MTPRRSQAPHLQGGWPVGAEPVPDGVRQEGWPDPEPDLRAVVALSDVAAIRTVLIATARARRALSYAEMLERLGHRFSRPKMRALCRALDAIDDASRAASEPELAVLVVRQSDGLPGQGWWTGDPVRAVAYDGPWTGPPARLFVRTLQERAFAYWASAPLAEGEAVPDASEAPM